MARWQRDREMRRKVAWALVAAEVLALAGIFARICLGYLIFVNARLLGGRVSDYGLIYITVGATAVVLAAAVYEGRLFVRGCRWARAAFIIENVALVLLGLLWFVKNRITGDAMNTEAALYGLLLPMLTLFPLLWPLLVFSPTPDAASETRGQG
jgi:hypothetical protein